MERVIDAFETRATMHETICVACRLSVRRCGTCRRDLGCCICKQTHAKKPAVTEP
jgi:hypothetical protein